MLVLGGPARLERTGSPEALEATQHLVVAAPRGARPTRSSTFPDSDWLLAAGPQSVPAPRSAGDADPGQTTSMRSSAGGASPVSPNEEMYASNASVSTTPPTRLVPLRSSVNPSPPSAKKLLTVTR